MKLAKLGLAASFCLSSIASGSQGDDWRLFGASGGKDNDAMFYLASEVRKSSSGTLRVWVKGVNFNKLIKASDVPADKAFIDAVSIKKMSGYEPPYLQLHPQPGENVALNMMIWEQLADEGTVPSHLALLWELNCAAWEYQIVSVQIGNGMQRQLPVSWLPIPPESNPRDLAKLLCPKTS